MRRRRWPWIVLGVLAGMILLPLLVGTFLPENYDAGLQFTIHRPPEEVWAALSNYEKHPMSGAMMKSVQRLPDENGLPVWVEEMGETKITVKTLESEAPNYVRRQLQDHVVPMTAVTEIRIEPVEGGSRITATSHMTIRSGTWHVPIFRVILTLTNGAEKGLKDFFTGIARELGEAPQFSAP